MSKENYFKKFKELPETIRELIGLVVIKADDQSNINIIGKILTISGFIEHLFLL